MNKKFAEGGMVKPMFSAEAICICGASMDVTGDFGGSDPTRDFREKHANCTAKKKP